VRLTAAGIIRNQFQYCSLICPFVLQGAITVPIATVQTPVTFLDSLASTGWPLKAIGAAAASVTGPANAAVTPLINNGVFLVVPKAFHALDVAIVEAFNVGASLLTPGGFIPAVQAGRTNILAALNQPIGTPTELDGRPPREPSPRESGLADSGIGNNPLTLSAIALSPVRRSCPLVSESSTEPTGLSNDNSAVCSAPVSGSRFVDGRGPILHRLLQRQRDAEGEEENYE
jgi:hypothetical protein